MFNWWKERKKREFLEFQKEARKEQREEEERIIEEERLEAERLEAERLEAEEKRREEDKLLEGHRREEALKKARENPEGKDSKNPWVTIIGDTVGEQGLQLSLDWNDAFIEYLKTSGVEGKDDTQIVQKWLAMIAQQQAERLGEEHLELEGKVSEFE